ncbi:hypothetical protein [Halomarina rubra]|uniref:Uncharacterized protein n=1 Tax=Halomarina rubra TaxID=2071873 RepID=A0ABD6ASL0_9EURY|nr:hypothetical protein [Halomarina rubra]
MSADNDHAPGGIPSTLARDVGTAIGDVEIQTGAVCLCEECLFVVDLGRDWRTLSDDDREHLHDLAATHADGQGHRVATLGLSLMDPETAVVFLGDDRPRLLHDATEGQ